ncbi:MAG: hypothetical protein ACREA2_16295, partial [Blastocatellia bacterium]
QGRAALPEVYLVSFDLLYRRKRYEVWNLLYHSLFLQKAISLLLIAVALSGQKWGVESRSGCIK